MTGELTTEQVLLIENLMYMSTNGSMTEITDINAPVGETITIGTWLETIDIEQVVSTSYGGFMTGDEWKNIIQAVKNDDTLMNMEIVAIHEDNASGGGGGVSAAFRNPETGEGVVAFKGTASYEWKDDFTGGSATDTADGVSTQQQLNALEWYQELMDTEQFSYVTVTGHSKGGNKAKYITIMDDSVDRCLSFDGQGFSDEFIEKYADKIAENQYKISNHNVDDDYVNILLNDVGETTYYEGYNYGEGKFLENHCANTFFKFNEDGKFETHVSERGTALKQLDEFFNSYLRSLSDDEREETLAFIGEIAEFFGSSEYVCIDTNVLLQLFLDGNNLEYSANLLAYLIEYGQKYPEFMESINSLFQQYEMEEPLKIVETIEEILNGEYFDLLYDVLDVVTGIIPDWLINWVRETLEKNGIFLSNDEIRKFLELIGLINDNMETISVDQNGEDKKVTSAGKEAECCQLKVKTIVLHEVKNQFIKYSCHLENYAEQVRSMESELCCIRLNSRIKKNLTAIVNRIDELTNECSKMGDIMEEIAGMYEDTESKIVQVATL